MPSDIGIQKRSGQTKVKRALVALRMFGVHAMECIPGRPLLYYGYRGGSAI